MVSLRPRELRPLVKQRSRVIRNGETRESSIRSENGYNNRAIKGPGKIHLHSEAIPAIPKERVGKVRDQQNNNRLHGKNKIRSSEEEQ